MKHPQIPNQKWFYSYRVRLFLLGATLVILSSVLFIHAALLDNSKAVSTTSQQTTGHQAEFVAALPIRLRIPTIAVDAAVQYVGLDPSGTGEMGVPDNFTDVGWYEPGVRPGMEGSAVIAGHYNGKEVAEAVFFDLDTLVIGDEVIVVDASDTENIFRVVKIESFHFDAPATEVFESNDNKKRLNLITCSGVWLPEENRFDKRTVVFTELQSSAQ